MADLSQTFRGSFAGIPFAMLSHSITGGRKTVKKAFPNSNKQLIEDLGLNPRSYSLRIAIYEDSAGSYATNRDRFLAVLEGADTGILVHPLYGSIENIKARTYTLDESFSSYGEARFTVVFEPDDTDGGPIQSEITATDIAQASQNAFNSVAENIVDSYSQPFGGVNFGDAVSVITNISDAFAGVTPTFSQVTNAIDEYSAELSNLQSNIIEFASSPQELVDSVRNLFSGISNLYSAPADALRVVEQMFGFGSNDESIELNTQSRLQRQANRNALNASMIAGALLEAYAVVPNVDFETVEQINDLSAALDDQFEYLTTSSSQDINSIAAGTNALSTETINSIAAIRVQVFEFLDNERLSAKRVITVNTGETSCRLLAYQFYGSSESGEAIADLNETSDVSFIGGDVEIFTA